MTEIRAGGEGLRLGLALLRLIHAYKQNDSMFSRMTGVVSFHGVTLQLHCG